MHLFEKEVAVLIVPVIQNLTLPDVFVVIKDFFSLLMFGYFGLVN